MDNPISIVEFCAGYGGLGLGIKRVLGERLRAVAYCELEGFAQANLVSKMEAGHLDAAPIWTDLLTFPYQDFHGLVDIAAAGIPCQPHSLAGKRAGGSDKRFLFGDWLDGLEKMRPRLIFIENVEGFLSSHMPDGTLCVTYTVERLEKMGYRVEAGVFSAAEVGAPHQRKRVFILAYNQCERIEELRRQIAGASEYPPPLAQPYYWPSPISTEARQGFQNRNNGMKGTQKSLTTVVVETHGPAAPANPSTSGSRQERPTTLPALPTDTAHETSSRNETRAWSTPQAHDAIGRSDTQKEKHGSKHGCRCLAQDVKASSGKLNPRWVETLMGLPVGWTMPSCASPAILAPMNSDCSAMASSQP